jgi:hypothetical protein
MTDRELLKEKAEKLGEFEPHFLLRAQDALAPEIVEEWANRAEQYGCPKDKVAGARRVAGEMRKFHTRKLPD